MKLEKYFDFELFPWEKFVFTLHCCVYREDGLPRFPDLLIFVGRGAGKNGYLAFEDFALISPYNGIPNYDIDICATAEEQARTSFDDIYNVLEKEQEKADPALPLDKIGNTEQENAVKNQIPDKQCKIKGRLAIRQGRF